MRSTWLGFALVCAGVAGCGDGGGLPGPHDLAAADMSIPSSGGDMAIPDMAVTDGGGGPSITFNMFAHDYAKALCARYAKCGQLDTAQLATCLEQNLQHTGWSQDTEISKGRVEIKEAQCIGAINGSRCDNSDSVSWGSLCANFLYTPHQADGATCLADAECTSGYCKHTAGSDAGTVEQVTGCNGVCAPPKATGAPCRINSQCAADSECDATNFVCVKRAALGEACFNPFNTAADPTRPDCLFALACPTFTGAAPPTCVTPATQATLGGSCDPYQGALTVPPSCATGMYCQTQYTGANATGGLCKMKLASGSVCDPKNEGSFSFTQNQCVDGTSCYKTAAQTNPTCQPPGSLNADCANGTCKVGLYCGPANKCVALLSDGQACTGTSFCPASGSLPFGQNSCVADNADAGAGTTCQPEKDVGSPCNPGFEDSLCAPADNANTSYCAPTGSGGGVCAPKCN